KLCIPYQPVSSSKIYGYLREAIIHGQAKSISFNSQLIPQGAAEHLSQGNSGIFYGMVLIYFKVAINLYLKIHLTVPGNLVRHMVKKSNSGKDLRFSGSVKI